MLAKGDVPLPEMGSRPKFVVCDPSLTAIGGHFLGYDYAIAAEFRDRGFQTGIAANESYQAVEEIDGVRIENIFRHDIWGRLGSEAKPPAPGFSDEDRRLLRLKYSRWGLFWSALSGPATFADHLADYPLSIARVEEFAAVAKIRATFDQILESDPPDDFSHLLKGVQRRSAEEAAVFERIHQAISLLRQDRNLNGVMLESARQHDLARLARWSAAATTFRDCLTRVVEAFNLGDKDHLFFPNMSFLDLRGVAMYLETIAAQKAPTLHLLFRRDIYRGGAAGWEAQEDEVHGKRAAFVLFRKYLDAFRVGFYTDTDMLTTQMNRFGVAPFRTVPIPVSSEKPVAPTPPRGKRVLALAAGGAQDAEQIVEALEVTTDEFSVQSAMLGEHSIEHARWAQERLAGEPRVELLSPYMTVDDTTDAIAKAGIVRALSTPEDAVGSLSSPFWRALAMGRLVIASARSWQHEALDYLHAQIFDAAMGSEGTRLCKALGVGDMAWQFRLSGSLGYVGEIRQSDGISVTEYGITHAWIEIEEGAEQLLITLGSSNSERSIVSLIVEQHLASDGQLPLVEHQIEICAGAASGACAVELDPMATLVWIGVKTVEGLSDQILNRFDVRQVAGVKLPELRVGVVEQTVENFELGGVSPFEQALKESAALPGIAWDSDHVLNFAEKFRDLLAPRCEYDLAYLGDAREEKGFVALAPMFDELDRAGTQCRAVMTGQIYTPTDSEDVDILVSGQKLRRRRQGVRVVERPLSMAEYNDVLAKSDIVLIPYDHLNYGSRSSGIFIEALSAGRPVIVPGASWMGGLLDAASSAYHAPVRDEAQILGKERFLDRQRLELLPHGRSIRLPEWRFDSGRLLLRGDSVVCTSMTIPVRSNHLFVRLTQNARLPDAVVSVHLVYRLADGNMEVGEDQRWLTTRSGEPVSLLSRIPPDADSVWIGLQTPSNEQGFWAEGLELEFWRVADRPALGPGGLTYNPTGDMEMRGRKLAACAREIMENYAQYRAGARGLQESFARYHTPSGLADALMAPLPKMLTNSRRLSAIDWGNA